MAFDMFVKMLYRNIMEYYAKNVKSLSLGRTE